VAKGAGLKVIAVCYQKNPFCLLSLKEKTPISSIAELKGKRVGVQSDNQVAFEGFLKANNLTTKDVDVVATQYSIAPLESGKYDAQIAFTTNEVLLAKEDKFTPVVLPFADNGLSFATNPIFVTTDTLKNKRDLIKAFLTAEIRGWTAAIKDPTQSAKYAAEIYGKDQNLTVAEQTLEATAQNAQIVTADTNKNGLFTMTSALLDQTVSSLGDMGTKITAGDLFDLSLLKEVYTEHPELIVNLPVTTA
jgi:ABC-type nitrate/sulfonate/bicarbonate transport system substrate-binding protein